MPRPETTARQQRGPKPGRFRKGQSGNPAGRPRGARHKLTVLGEKILEADAAAIMAAVVVSAKGGDPTAMRLCVERLVPVRKGRPVAFSMPRLTTADDRGGCDRACGRTYGGWRTISRGSGCGRRA